MYSAIFLTNICNPIRVKINFPRNVSVYLCGKLLIPFTINNQLSDLSHYRLVLPILISYKWNHTYEFFGVWFLLLRVMLVRCIHVWSVSDSNSFYCWKVFDCTDMHLVYLFLADGHLSRGECSGSCKEGRQSPRRGGEGAVKAEQRLDQPWRLRGPGGPRGLERPESGFPRPHPPSPWRSGSRTPSGSA